MLISFKYLCQVTDTHLLLQECSEQVLQRQKENVQVDWLSNEHHAFTFTSLRCHLFMWDNFTAGRTHLGFPQEELQVPAAQDAVVLDVAREMHSAGAVYGAVNLHVAVDGV